MRRQSRGSAPEWQFGLKEQMFPDLKPITPSTRPCCFSAPGPAKIKYAEGLQELIRCVAEE